MMVMMSVSSFLKLLVLVSYRTRPLGNLSKPFVDFIFHRQMLINLNQRDTRKKNGQIVLRTTIGSERTIDLLLQKLLSYSIYSQMGIDCADNLMEIAEPNSILSNLEQYEER